MTTSSILYYLQLLFTSRDNTRYYYYCSLSAEQLDTVFIAYTYGASNNKTKHSQPPGKFSIQVRTYTTQYCQIQNHDLNTFM